MNSKDLLFEVELPQKKVIQKKKLVLLKRYQAMVQDENFIEALSMMNTNKVYYFEKSRRDGVSFYKIKINDFHRYLNKIIMDKVMLLDLNKIKKHFESLDYEVQCSTDRTVLRELCIRGRK